MVTIDANPASGTRDYLPAEVARREEAFATIRRVFRSHGFDPLDTPAFERLEVLTGKYGEEGDQLIFKILRRGDHEASGQADLALRYDLTVPLARVAARYGSQLPMPFKRYQIAPVWRADRPGKGRFREFYQCDLDVVGSTSPVADASTIAAVVDALAALGLDGCTVQMNHRQALSAMVHAYGIPKEQESDALVALDKLAKIGTDGVAKELSQRGISAAAIEPLMADVGELTASSLSRDMGADTSLVGRIAETEQGRAALADIETVRHLVGDQATSQLVYSPVLARGLTYYTGVVFEVVHDALDVTIAAGGRYDGLIGMFQQEDVPATGGSLGLERILLLLEEQQDAEVAGPDVVVTIVDDEFASAAVAIAERLRTGGLTTDLYAGTGRLGKQLKYADRRAATAAIIVGRGEIEAGTVTVKHLATGDQTTVDASEVVNHVSRLKKDAS
ncbi:MAG: histidine--tRNA ligase [Nitriliruptoraceae bacterium]